jgi:hypothetical protein
VDGTDLYNVRRELNLCLEIGVASKVEGEIGKDAVIKTPLTDAGMEMALDMVEDQAFAALFGDPKNEWTELFKCFVMRVERVSGQRGASSDRDRRWAARQLSVICDVVADLPPGVPVSVNHPISLFSQVEKRNPEAHMEHAGEICDALIAQTAAPDWERVQATLGVRRLGLRAIGLAPLSSDLPDIATQYGDDLTDTRGEAPILREIKHDDIQMEGNEETGLIDEYAISTNVVSVKVVDKKDKVAIDGEGDQP